MSLHLLWRRDLWSPHRTSGSAVQSRVLRAYTDSDHADITIPHIAASRKSDFVSPGSSGLITAVRYITVKLAALFPGPAGVVTLILPKLAPAGTVAVIRVAELTVNAAGVPLNLTAVVPVKFTPLTTTLAPTTPLVGANPVIRGATAKLVALVAVPPGVVTLMGPVVAFGGTVAVICVLPLTVKAAARPLNFTAVAPVKARPEIVMAVPGAPAVGENVVIAGATAKLDRKSV